jgi:elongation factor Ts
MMDCKKALVEAAGDAERAAQILRERGLIKAKSKAGRTTSDGLIVASLAQDGHTGVLLEVNCETDFVAKTDEFSLLVRELAELARDRAPADVDALLALPLAKGTARDRVADTIAKLGENIEVRRLARLEAPEQGFIRSYIHAGGKIGTLVAARADDPSNPEALAFGSNVCMHVTALQPLAVCREDLPAEEIAKEREILTKQAESEGKPAKVVEKMVEGRLRKYFAEVVLLEQPLVMDPDRSVEKAAKEVGVNVLSFCRLQLGEEAGA